MMLCMQSHVSVVQELTERVAGMFSQAGHDYNL